MLAYSSICAAQGCLCRGTASIEREDRYLDLGAHTDTAWQVELET